ncbi:chromatin assembly factor 1 subunit B-like [Protopterus annectens]|uniref:chromatin assembly factor 1 subunit B-like n=1 Tax=Protopterus annectens TaxID=7888 RepID=UPI001CFA8064|nr:chromatin assembly factor 1 subunit B-like [Protopterus annectens]
MLQEAAIIDRASTSMTKTYRMFHDDSMRSFFRRPSFTPDGLFLITPAGCVESGENIMNTTYIFSRKNLKRPLAHLPCPGKATLAVRCCPVFFELRKTKEDTSPQHSFLSSLPYRLVFAVASEDSIFLYDTQQSFPFSYISGIHYHTLSDLSWSADGSFLAVSSTDGYCSFITFEKDELGIPLKEKPVFTSVTPTTAEKKLKKAQTSRVASPVPRTVDGSPTNKNLDVNSPSTPLQSKASSNIIGTKETPSTPLNSRVSPLNLSPEEKKPVQSGSSSAKGPQPRRITLNTLQSWGTKPSTPAPRRISLIPVKTDVPVSSLSTECSIPTLPHSEAHEEHSSEDPASKTPEAKRPRTDESNASCNSNNQNN